MQLVSREVLFDVMARKHDMSLTEATSSSAFQTFCKKATKEFNRSRQMTAFSDAMLQYMKSNVAQIRFVGQGSSRIVFAMADGTALKLAKTEAGIAQNKQEAKVCMDPKMKYQIFPDFYGADKKNWLALNCELCAPAERQDFFDVFRAQPRVISELIEFVFKAAWKGKWALDEMLQKTKQFFTTDQPSDVKRLLLGRVVDAKTPAFAALHTLFEFYYKNGLDELLVGDLEYLENWGITIRDNQKVLVVIDAGFSDSVWQKHYDVWK